MTSYGPSILEKYTYNQSLNKFIDDCTKYVGGLGAFGKYCVWRYTIGSASVNSFLIFGKIGSNAGYWTYLTFLYYYNTYISAKFKATLPKAFSKWKEYFSDPSKFTKLSRLDQDNVASEFIPRYIVYLQGIIKKAPKTPGEFHVFKVASKYPQLPSLGSSLPSNVAQLPFNSTTISPYFNFAPFISPSSDCCFFDITVPKGSTCLYIPEEYHAYPFEMEILLPRDCIFHIERIYNGRLNFISPDAVNMVRVQPEKKEVMGAVFEINRYFPCKIGGCTSMTKTFNIYDTVLM